MKRLLVIPLLLCFLSIISSPVTAQTNDVLSAYRQKLMKSNGMHMSMIGDILKHGFSFPEQIRSHAGIVRLNGLMMEKAFEEKVTSGKTDSKPEVWTNWVGFIKAAKKSADAAADLAMTAKSGDMSAIQAKMQAAGKTCGGCHRSFRQPKSKRFKR